MSKLKWMRNIQERIDTNTIAREKYQIPKSEYNTKRFFLAFFGKSVKSYYITAAVIFIGFFCLYLLAAKLVGYNLINELFNYPTIRLNLEVICYFLVFLTALIASRRLYYKVLEVRDHFLGEIEEDIRKKPKPHQIDLEKVKIEFRKYVKDDTGSKTLEKEGKILTEYRNHINKWIKRAFGRKYLLIATIGAILFYFFNPIALLMGQYNLHAYFGRFMTGTMVESGVVDCATKIPMFFGLIVLVFNCLGVAVVIYIMSKWEKRTSMLHPDGSGGLRPIGELALRNVFSWAAAMTAIIISISMVYIYLPEALFEFAYILLIVFSMLIAASTILIFIVPLRSVHIECMNNKTNKLREVQKPFDKDYAKFQKQLTEQEPLDPRLIEELILLNTLNEQIEEMRDWPWDTGILWKAFLAIMTPILIQFLIQGINLIT